MTIKVLKKVDIEAWKKEVECVNCISTLEVHLEDLTKRVNDCIFYCPVCRTVNYIKLLDIDPKYRFAIKTERQYSPEKD